MNLSIFAYALVLSFIIIPFQFYLKEGLEIDG